MLTLKDMTDLKKFIINNKKVCLLFSATWCGPCKVFKKKLEEKNELFKDLKIGYCDIDNNEFDKLCELFSIKSIPTTVFVELDNTVVKEIGRVTGFDWIKFIFTINSLFLQ